MELVWLALGWGDYLYWQQNDKKVLKQINLLIRAVMRDLFDGIGKLEPLKANFKGWWSRRITGEHRLIYKAEDNGFIITQCRYHYYPARSKALKGLGILGDVGFCDLVEVKKICG